MGQQQILQLKQKIHSEHELSNNSKNSLQFLTYAFQMTERNQKEMITKQQLLEIISSFLDTKHKPNKRRRSFDLCQENKLQYKNTEQSKQNNQVCLTIQHQMLVLESFYHEICSNITEIMATQKVYKIRQHFRKLILKLLGLDEFLIYFIHEKGRLQFQDFKNNYITDILQLERCQELEQIINSDGGQTYNKIYEMFDIDEKEQQKWLYDWTKLLPNKGVKVCYMWKYNDPQRTVKLNKRLIQKLSSICMISSVQQQTTIIQSYSKDLLDIFQILISENELNLSLKLNQNQKSLRQFEEKVTNDEKTDIAIKKNLLKKIRQYQQFQYNLLQNIRMYKRYVCQQNKNFLDFDEDAELIFVSNNYQHKISKRISDLYQNGNLYIQNIFRQEKSINDFLKKALQKKIKNNKLYELDYETKARVKFNDQGRVTRFHIIFEEFQSSSNHSSTNLYISSSTKILSDSSSKKSGSDKSQQVPQIVERKPSHSTLLNTLQKQNPGIINSGWINLFVKDDQFVRKNTHFKNKKDKSYTVKRSLSLRKDNQLGQNENNNDQILPDVNIESIDLNLLSFEQQSLEPMVIKVFSKLQYFNPNNISYKYFENFLNDIHNGYQIHNNPFHNFSHGVNVMHTCYLLSHTPKARQSLTPFKIFTIVLSGLCHDVGHTGFTNLFEIASQSKKAILYNDSSPLQNYHASYSFELLRKPQNNFLQNLTAQEAKAFRKHFISNILYTDIKEHFPLLKKFNSYLKEQIPKNQQYLNILSGVIIHTSDFGGSAKQFEICKQWSLKVNLQFSNQYKKEGELGLPLTSYMKDLTNINILSKNQGGFLKVIVFPLYEAMHEFNGNDFNVKRMKQYVQKNIKQWQKIQQQSVTIAQ